MFYAEIFQIYDDNNEFTIRLQQKRFCKMVKCQKWDSYDELITKALIAASIASW